MTTAILSAGRYVSRRFTAGPRLDSWLVLVPLALLGIALIDNAAGLVIVESIGEAYLAVSVFVAATLLIFYALESVWRIDTGAFLARRRRWQPPLAALLGALPGCGGAVIVVTQFVRGRVGLGGVVAALTATMGDAAFLLLAREPQTGALVFALGLGVGTISGYVVDLFHKNSAGAGESAGEAPTCKAAAEAPKPLYTLHRIWLWLLVPGLALGVLGAFQIDVDAWFSPAENFSPTTWFGFGMGALTLFLWANNRQHNPAAEASGTRAGGAELQTRVVADTAFITAWVVAAFLVYELGVHFSGIDLAQWFAVWAPFVPLVGVLVGFIPGCGPQIVVTTLYLSGVVPLSAQLGNAISNDGDALFPAIALAPRTAILATLYSAVPAVLVAYGTYFWFE